MDDLASIIGTIVIVAVMIALGVLFGGVMLVLILGAIAICLCVALLKGIGDWVITLFHGRRDVTRDNKDTDRVDSSEGEPRVRIVESKRLDLHQTDSGDRGEPPKS